MKGSKEEIKAIDLRSDYKVNPIGIHNVAPRLSWRMTAYGKNRKQSAYQIQVFKKESDIKEVLVWDSEKVYSGESVNIPYKGKQLASRERVYWKVRIWDEKENVSEWSEEAFFEAGLLNKTDWEAEWICAPEKAAAVYFRKVCNIEKQPKSGRLYISGLGYYEAYLNGKKCGEDVLTPNRTHYTERVFYHTYDITTAVVHGENVFGVELGNGWYNQKDKINEKKLWYGYPKLLFQIEIEYADGDKDVFISDENTKWHESPRIYNNIYFGEIYDARKESIGWREKDFEDLDWKFAGKAEKPGGELTKQKAPSDQKICELFPKKISEVTPGMYVIDFGQNMTGWVKMRVSGKEGDKVQLRFGEELWPDGKINYYSTGSGWKQQKDIYILSGKKEEYYEPAFTWHGFRYVEVQGYPGIPKREDFVAVHIRAGVERSGKFICSNALINQIQKASLWSMESGLHGGIPLDSPHRERQGYGGDALITAKAMMYSYDMHEFYSDWMDDFIDAQDKTTGFLPHTVPCQDGGGGPAWGSALIIITWLMYRYYGDTKSAEEYFDNMIHWMQFLQTGMEKGIVEGEGTDKDCLGEWSTPGEILIPPRFVNTFFYAYNAKLMTELAEVLGRSADAEYFQNQYNETVLSFRNEFYDSKNGRYSIGAQGTEAFANKLGAIRERELCEVKQYLEKHITKECEGNLDTGIFGTPLLFETLVEFGLGEVAYHMITTIVQGAIVQPSLPRFSLKANKEIHDRIFEFSKCDKMKIWGMASIYPHFTQEEYREEAIRCVKELGFVGLKLTPIGHACDPESEDGMYAFSVAAELGVPMMVHTGSGIPFSSPMHILKAAKEYPELKIVVAHAGMGVMAREAVILAQICENVYLEPTWTGVADMGMIYKELGAGKIMFSSDHVNNVTVQYETIKTVVPEKEMEQVLYKTAESVYKITL